MKPLLIRSSYMFFFLCIGISEIRANDISYGIVTDVLLGPQVSLDNGQLQTRFAFGGVGPKISIDTGSSRVELSAKFGYLDNFKTTYLGRKFTGAAQSSSIEIHYFQELLKAGKYSIFGDVQFAQDHAQSIGFKQVSNGESAVAENKASSLKVGASIRTQINHNKTLTLSLGTNMLEMDAIGTKFLDNGNKLFVPVNANSDRPYFEILYENCTSYSCLEYKIGAQQISFDAEYTALTLGLEYKFK